MILLPAFDNQSMMWLLLTCNSFKATAPPRWANRLPILNADVIKNYFYI